MRPGYLKSSEKTIKIHISELKIGMYVSKLDRPWLETPFLMQGFMIESLDDIDAVAEYAQHVWIDAVGEEWVAPEERAAVKGQAKKVSYINKIDAKAEHAAAMDTYREARRLTRSLLDDLRLGGVINSEQAKSTVKECVHSILRNSDALIWMSKIRTQDEYTAEHCLNVCILAIAFGRHLGMSEGDLERLGLCGLLHDVGKMRVQPEVLHKPASLTEKEFNMMKAHTVHGRNLLMSSPGIPNSTIDVAYSHHERIDGTGYPRGLSSSGISEFAKIIAIVDAYDAMTADRCYSPSIPSTEALKIIFKDRGTHFDDRLGLEFIKSVGLYPPGTLVELVNGLIAIVFETNSKYRHLPKVIAVKKQDAKLEKNVLVDLSGVERGSLDKSFLIKRALNDGSFGVYIKDYREQGLALG
ncbi:HD-GYP domain-containing protein [Cellvibrio zantedeschiae]|uniref:HD-GYP domain-containing protein n=1 Tax=Cellvibrio zantedeschiae TaxID=1237077 RepID=UPI0027E3ED44|nr:HD-GYP domain-containing protein [Cellvibrio zantedeschiae]